MLRRAVIACAMLCSIVAGAACSSEVHDSPLVEGTVAALTASDCPAGYNVIQGTNATETLTGTAGNDCIVGKAGNDTIFGRGGNDFLIGGDGNDTLFGEAGDDTLYGEAGGDRLEGGDGNDVLWGGLNVDNLYGQGGDDQLNGEAAGDTLEGGPGKDLLRGGDGDDTLRGGDDDDRLLGESGVDQLYGDSGRDVLHGGTQADNIWGGDGDDVIQGFDGNDTLNGEAGDDAVIGGLGTNTINGGAGTDACTGTGCEKPALTPTGCTADAQCSGGKRCILDVGLCLLCVSDQDGDGVCDSQDACVSDANKSAPGVCGCGVADTDSDNDGSANCTDGCASDASKTSPGVCGCGVADTDSDNDGSANCNDGCPNDAAKTAAGACGCGVADTNSDGDAAPNCMDGCPIDPSKITAGLCGCGVADTDSDGDGMPNCTDGCPADPAKITAGVCGCGTVDTDSDNDGTANCHDGCPTDASKTAAGTCGCGVADTDSDSDGRPDCTDVCPGSDDSIDSDSDGTPDGCDEPTECQIWTTGAHVHSGDAHVSTPADLAALEGIVCITGSLYVSGPEITSLVGLDSLFGVAEVVSLSATQLTSLDGLDALRTVGSMGIYFNSALQDILGLGSLTEVRGDLRILGNASLGSVDGLEALTDISRSLWIMDNGSLSNLHGLASLAHLGEGMPDPPLGIRGNAQLPACWIWALQSQVGLTYCGTNTQSCDGNTGTGSCGTLPPDFACVPGARGPGVYDGYLNVDTADELASLSGLACVTQGLMLAYTPLSDLSALSNLQAIGGGLSIYASPALTSLHGLENLRSVGYGVWITNNSQLSSISALTGLTSIGSRLFEIGSSNALNILNNAALPGCQTWQLAQQLGYTCGTEAARCTGNTGTSSCGTLPPDFSCVPGAVGPGVYDGYIDISPWSPSGMQLNEFGGLTCVTADLRIYGSSATELSVLSSLEQVGGSLWLHDNQGLTSLAGLEHLKSVGRSLDISNHASLTSLAALSSLTTVAGSEPSGILTITNNTNLPQCSVWALEDQVGKDCGWSSPDTGFYACRGNRGQGSCGTLPADFACVPGATGPGVYDGWLSITPDTNGLQLDELGGLTCVTDSMFIYQTNATDLSTLSSLQMVGNSLSISSNPSLVSLTGLEHLTNVGWHLSVWGNNALTNLAGLSSLTSIGDDPNSPSGGNLSISSNASLPACWAWGVSAQTEERCGQQDWSGAWLECRGNTGQGSCGTLPADFACVPGATGPGVYDGSVYYWGPNSSSLSEFGGVTCVTGDVNISNSDLSDLTALAGLQMVGGSFNIYGNPSLVSLAGLEQLRSVGHHLDVSYNNALRDLDALGSLTSIGDAPGNPFSDIVSIWNNASLPACEPLEVASLSGKACGRPDWNTGSWTDCSGNLGAGDCELESLPPYFLCTPGVRGPGVYDGTLDFAAMFPNGGPSGAFGGVQCVTGDLIISQTTQSDLTTLSHLQMVGGRVAITDNANLTSIAGLEQLTDIRGTLDVANNPMLVDLAPLSQLTHLAQGGTTSPESGVLHVVNNASLAGCWAWMIADQTGQRCGHPNGESQWSECRGNTGEGECGDLPDGFVCQFGAHGPGVFPGTLFIASSPENGWTLQELGGVTCVLGSVVVGGTELQDLQGAWKLRGIALALGIHDNPNLVSLSGLEDLEDVGAALGIQNNPLLSDLSGLSNLVSLAERTDWFYGLAKLSINNNTSLPACWETVMEVQTGLECGQTDWDDVWTDCSGNTGAGTCE